MTSSSPRATVRVRPTDRPAWHASSGGASTATVVSRALLRWQIT
jgi:hypothetical protein